MPKSVTKQPKKLSEKLPKMAPPQAVRRPIVALEGRSLRKRY